MVLEHGELAVGAGRDDRLDFTREEMLLGRDKFEVECGHDFLRRRSAFQTVMAGLDPAIHENRSADGRNKSGHDAL